MPPPGGADDLAALLADQADSPSVTAGRLDGTAECVADLRSPLVEHLVDGEEPAFCFESHADGVGVGDPDDTHEPERGGVFLFTDLRVYLLLGAGESDRSRSLRYESVTDARLHTGMSRHRIQLACDGTRYHLWIPTSEDRADLEAAVEYATYQHKRATPDVGDEDGDRATELDGDDGMTVEERLERLGDARSRGLISDEEFERRKQQLLRGDDESDAA